ncbi:MAG TPA: glycosyltransferase family 4 protein [Chitinophagaceae bacterium]
MKIAFIARSTLYKVHGGITVQVLETAKYLRELGADVVIRLTDEKINYAEFDLLHFFDITRPANILYHIERTNKPFVLSPVLIDYSEYDKQHRRGIPGFILRMFSTDTNEYIKAVSRWFLRKDKLQSKKYLWKGQGRSIRYILEKAEMILPNSKKEYDQLKETYAVDKPYVVVPNGIDDRLFRPDNSALKDEKLVLCAARIEGVKNQLNLVKALNNTEYNLLLIGDVSPNQKEYYRHCREAASANIKFISRLPQEELLQYYRKVKVHILPSWFETCGLSSLEAAAMGCNIVITNKGFSREYFGDEALYCDPGDVESIYQTVHRAAGNPSQKNLQEKVLSNYTWRQAAIRTLEAYKKILPGINTGAFPGN